MTTDEVEWFPNKPIRVFMIVMVLAMVLGYLVAVILYPILLTFPLWFLPVVVLSVLVLVYVTLIRHLYVTVGIGRDRVVLKKLLSRVTIARDEVEKVILSRPILSDDTKHVDWWGEPTPKMTVILRDGSQVDLSAIQDGIKLRIARVLDPENHPS